MLRRTVFVLGVAIASTIGMADWAYSQSIIDGGGLAAGGQALYWTRSDPQKDLTGTSILSPDQLHLDWEPGAEFWLGYQDPDSPWGFDLRYFWIEQFEDDARLILPIQINDRFPAASIGLESFLQGAEFSGTYLMSDWLMLSSGLRWIELTETYTIDITLPGSGVLVGNSTHVRNEMIGWQVGGKARVLDFGSFTTSLVGKTGLYHNWRTSGNDAVAAGNVFPLQDSDARLAFASEARIESELWLTSYLSIVGGYQMLYLDGVLRGETFALTGANQAGGSDSILYHGAFLGITLYR